MKKVWSWIILAAVIVLIIAFFVKNKQFLEILKNMQLNYFLILSGLTILLVFFQGLQIKYITKMYGKNLNAKEWFGLNIISLMADYITPFKGGVAVKAVYLKKVHGMPYTRGVTTVGASTIISLWIFSFLGIVLSLFYKMEGLITLLFITSFIVTGIVTFLLPSFPLTKIKKINYLIRSINELKSLRKNLKAIMFITFLKICGLAIITLRIYYSFQAISYNLPFNASLVTGLFAILSIVIHITPANLGVRESVIAFSAKAFGVGTDLGLSAAIIDRAAVIAVVFTLGPIFSYILSQQKNKGLKSPEGKVTV